MRLIEVCTGRARETVINGRKVLTAIEKTAASGAVVVGPLGLEGDEQADPSVHGGVSKAVYAYPSEHLPFWQTVRAQARVALWDEPLTPGAMGENLLLHGLREPDMWIGDRLVIGGARAAVPCVLAISEPRYPCFKFNARMGFSKAAKLMVESGFCGCYLTVIEPGTVQAGDAVELLRGPRELSIRDLFRARAKA